MDQLYRNNGLNNAPILIIRKKCFFKYVSKQYSFRQRTKLIEEHYLLAAFLLRRDVLISMLNLHITPLAHVVGCSGKAYQVSLVQCPELCSEGELSIILHEADSHKRLATLTFLFGRRKYRPGVTIGGLQGPNGEESKAEIVQATKDLHGLRPKNAVLIGLYALCNSIAVTHIEAISLRNNPSKKIGHCFVADNDTFWTEISNDRNADGDFVLPLILPERAIEQVPSKRKKLWQARKMLKDDIMQQSKVHISRMLNLETIRNKTCYGAGPTAGAKLDYENFGTNSDC